jgi:cytochrome c oxidase subunit 2
MTLGAVHDVRMPAGPQAAALYDLWTWMLIACVIVFVLVIGALAIAVWRTPRANASTPPQVDAHPRMEAGMRRVVAIATGVSATALVALLVASFLTDRAIARLPLDDALHIDLVAHQFWWEARYDASDPGLGFVTANELHVPVGRPVLLTLRSDDVIHSFWVPSLHGKKDLIPGRESTFAFRADRVGTFSGQCAEFCGYQHAHMTLLVFADAPADYERWAAVQRQPAVAPRNDQERHGQELFDATCAMCHRIGGTRAQARRAPDLTHVASRSMLAAGTVPNDDVARSYWIADPQKIKPGVNMPPRDLPPEDLAALNAYLGALR